MLRWPGDDNAFTMAIISAFGSRRREANRARRRAVGRAGLGLMGALGMGMFYLIGIIMVVAFVALIGLALALGKFFVWAYKNLPIEANVIIWVITLIVGIIIYLCS